MKYRNACLLLLALICALSLLGCSAANEEPDADPVVARYRDTEIRQSLVDYEKKNQSALSGGKEVRERDAVDQLLLNRIMLDEAERLGLSVTQEEVDAEFAAQKKNYEDFLEVRTDILLNDMIPSEQRATLISVNSFTFSLVMIVMSTLMGSIM